MPAKLPRLAHVKYVRARGRVYAYFNTGQKKGGRPIYVRLPDPSTIGFFDSYAAMKGARAKRQKINYTIADLARDYELSGKYASHAANTQILYSKTLRQIVRYLGDWPVNDLQRSDIQSVLDKDLVGPGARKIFLILLTVIYKWGVDRGKAETDPTKGIAREKGGEHQPWPEAVVEEALVASDDLVRLSAHLLYFTGQRIGDVARMRWTDIRDNIVSIVQQKTGKEIWVPLLSELRDELNRTPKLGMTILARPDGSPYSDETIRARLKSFTADRGVKTVPHGLRKNAVNAFLEAGCSVAEVSAITGQTYKIVEYYAKRVNRKHMAEAAVIKLENRRRTGKQGGKHEA